MKLGVLLAVAMAWTTTASGIVDRGSGHDRSVALTFDAGADRGYAALILRTLENAHVRATFGMTGRWARANPDLLRRMARDGDGFINHTYDHQSFTGFSSRTAALTAGQRRVEVQATEALVKRLTGKTTKPYFRPPYGDYDAATFPQMRSLGYSTMVMWTVDSLGWEHISRAAILRRCLSALKPGGIYLMHVGIQSQDALALPDLIVALKRSRYRIETIGQILAGR